MTTPNAESAPTACEVYAEAIKSAVAAADNAQWQVAQGRSYIASVDLARTYADIARAAATMAAAQNDCSGAAE